MSQEPISEETKKPDRRRLIIYIVVGVVVICVLCGIASQFLPSSDDGGEPASPPEQTPTAVQLPEETPLPTNTPEPVVIPTLIPTEVPTEAPTDTPDVVENEASDYFLGLVPSSLLMAGALENMSNLFLNPQLLDDGWYDEVTGQMGVLLVTAKELAEAPVPDNCDICSEVNIEMQNIFNHADGATLDWISWLEDKSEITYLESIALHISEIGATANRATAMMESYIE